MALSFLTAISKLVTAYVPQFSSTKRTNGSLSRIMAFCASTTF